MLLSHVGFSGGVLEVAAAGEGPYEITFIVDGGRVAKSATGVSSQFDTRNGAFAYVRAVVEDGEGRRAWVQPVFLDDGEN